MRDGSHDRRVRSINGATVLGGVFALLAVAACDGTKPLGPAGGAALQVTVEGRLERGQSVVLSVSGGGGALPPGSVSWSVVSGRAVRLLPPDTATLTDTGATTLLARTAQGTVTLALRVSPPPTIVFDMHDVASDGTLGDRSIYRIALDGRDITRIVGGDGRGDNVEPTVAGGRVVFTSYGDGYPALYAVPLSGGAAARLTALTGAAYQPALSSDGTRLAFIASDSGDDKLWIAGADGSGATRATAGFGQPGAEEAAPSWGGGGTSPDNTLAFVSTTLGDAALVALTVSTDSADPITNGSTTDVDPAWSPDGRRIAFSSTRDGDLGIFVLTVATGEVRRISPSPGTAGQPNWLSDGRIVYTAWTVSGTTVTSQLVWLDPASPTVVHTIATPTGDPEYARAAR